MSTEASTDTLRCPQCRRRTEHTVAMGPLEQDPQHLNDPLFDFHAVTYRCTECGKEQRRRRLPNLLSEVFHSSIQFPKSEKP